jgi:ribonuclease D
VILASNFANLFDTMYAARVLGYPLVGLDNMLAEKFNQGG